MQKNPEWLAYDAAYAQWQRDLAEWEKQRAAATNAAANRDARLRELQARAVTVSNEIEAEYFRRKDKLKELVTTYVNGQSLISGEDGDGLIEYECPHCGTVIFFDENAFDMEEEHLCPNCHRKVFEDDGEDGDDEE